MKKPCYSAKPGQILDWEGKPRDVYLGKPKSTIRNFDKYGDIQFSEKRRAEIKREFEIRSLIRTFTGEMSEEAKLLKQIK